MSLGSLAYPLVSTIYMGTLNSYPAAIYNVMWAEYWQKDIAETLFSKFVQQFWSQIALLDFQLLFQVMAGVMVLALTLTLGIHLKLK